MRLFGWEISAPWATKADSISLDTLMHRLEGVYATASNIAVTPENCMQSPTVSAIVHAISNRIATLPVEVKRKVTSNGRTRKEAMPNHPVAKLLMQPNDWQNAASYWLDATSCLVRWGNFYAQKARGQTGPIRKLIPLMPSSVSVEQDITSLAVVYRASLMAGGQHQFTPAEVHHVRGSSRDFLVGDSPVMDIREAIALDIAAERMGATVFGNSAMPSLIFKHSQGNQGFKTDEARAKFAEEVHAAYAGKKRFRPMMLPAGIELDQSIPVEADKAQFLATRQYQRTVIAGAFNVPPHMVGDLSKGTFNNVEQQSIDFVQQVVLPYCRMFEAAMERDLLTAEDRAQGIIIRFNLEGALRGDFKTRQEGLNIQRQAGVISANDWREVEGQNPISADDGGDEYWRQGPSGQSAATEQGQDPAADAPQDETQPEDEAAA